MIRKWDLENQGRLLKHVRLMNPELRILGVFVAVSFYPEVRILHPDSCTPTGGAVEQPCSLAALYVHLYSIPDALPRRLPPLRGHTLGQADSADAARLRADDVNASSLSPCDGILQNELRHLRIVKVWGPQRS